MTSKSSALLGVALLAVFALSACGANPTLLTVNASATTRTAPDLAIVTLGVVARGPNARAAQEAQTARMNAVMAAVRAAGVADNEVQTIDYALDPQYSYPRNAAPRITGYESRNTIAIRVRDISAISGLVDATVADGANQLQGIQFTYQDEEASLDAARAQAVSAARARAERYAEAADMKVARVLSITEPGATIPPPVLQYRTSLLQVGASAEQSAANAIAPGELDNRSNVTVVFELR